ncbi:aminotransferase class IV family protein [Allorhizobium pseudoryzae]|uniref:aminotransferase class IV family protein n=1 Tax=Allorhizobium pseudoryzae TaxID=379684 RepID=UPI003D0014DD
MKQPRPSARAAKQTIDFLLIETLRWEPEAGFLRLDQHLRRLSRSADALGFRQPVDAKDLLKAAVSGEEDLRVRLTMNFRGKVEVTTLTIKPEPEGRLWRLKIADQRMKSDDALYRHKTTRREPYDAARAEFDKSEADEVLLLNERGELCEGTITNLFVESDGGVLITPPLSSGLLPGILRADLIREGKARSDILRPADLKGRKVFVGNSLRGLIAAELVD